MADKSAHRSKLRGDGDIQKSVLQKKFKIDDGKSKYIEQSTLLEPSNVMTHKQDEEEMKEVSFSLAELKRKHDVVKKQVNEKEQNLEIVRKEIQQLEYQEGDAEGVVYELSTRKKQIENAINHTKKKNQEENMNSRIYGHMIERVNKDLIAMEIKKKELENSLRNKELMYEEQKEQFRKTKEARLQSKTIFDSLIVNVGNEQKERKQRIVMLTKSIDNKQQNVRRRADRIQRQRDIAEAAANENKDADEKKMRENFMLNKLWNAFIRKKMEKEMKQSAHIDDAFKKIKTATGVTDVQELVHKFLTREQTYSELLVAVADSENRIDKLRRENEQLRTRLNELKISAEDVEGTPHESEEITKLRKEYEEVKREEALKKERYYNVEIVQDLVDNWSRKVIVKIDDEINEKQAEDIDIVEAFDRVCQIVLSNLEEYEKEDEDEMGPSSNMMNDFLTDDFVQKNIRVRPSSGKTNEEDVERSRIGSQARHHTDTAEGNVDKQYNDDLIELDAQRKLIKDRNAKLQEEIARKKKLEKGEDDKKK